MVKVSELPELSGLMKEAVERGMMAAVDIGEKHMVNKCLPFLTRSDVHCIDFVQRMTAMESSSVPRFFGRRRDGSWRRIWTLRKIELKRICTLRRMGGVSTERGRMHTEVED